LFDGTCTSYCVDGEAFRLGDATFCNVHPTEG
jgi:hypothetical protein